MLTNCYFSLFFFIKPYPSLPSISTCELSLVFERFRMLRETTETVGEKGTVSGLGVAIITAGRAIGCVQKAVAETATLAGERNVSSVMATGQRAWELRVGVAVEGERAVVEGQPGVLKKGIGTVQKAVAEIATLAGERNALNVMATDPKAWELQVGVVEAAAVAEAVSGADAMAVSGVDAVEAAVRDKATVTGTARKVAAETVILAGEHNVSSATAIGQRAWALRVGEAEGADLEVVGAVVEEVALEAEEGVPGVSVNLSVTAAVAVLIAREPKIRKSLSTINVY